MRVTTTDPMVAFSNTYTVDGLVNWGAKLFTALMEASVLLSRKRGVNPDVALTSIISEDVVLFIDAKNV